MGNRVFERDLFSTEPFYTMDSQENRLPDVWAVQPWPYKSTFMHCLLRLQWILCRDMNVTRTDRQTHIQTADTCLKWIFKIYYTATRFKFRPSGKKYSLNVEMIFFCIIFVCGKVFLNRMMWWPGEVRMEGRVRRVSYRMMFRALCSS